MSTATPAKAPPRTFPALIDSSRERLAAVLPAGCSPERFQKTALVEFSRNPDLAKCRPESVLIAVMQAAELGLEVGKPLDLCHLVPFGAECQLLIDYKGFLALARRTGEYRLIDARLVYGGDYFVHEYNPELSFFHRPSIAGRGQIVGAYAYAKFANGEAVIEWMPVADIEKIRQGSRSTNSPAWKNHYGEMCRKVPLKRLLKRQARSVEVARAAALDDAEYDHDQAEVLRRDPGQTKSQALAQRLRGQPQLPEPEPAPEYQADEGTARPLYSEAGDEDLPQPTGREPGEEG